jgi:hypothetical protein
MKLSTVLSTFTLTERVEALEKQNAALIDAVMTLAEHLQGGGPNDTLMRQVRLRLQQVERDLASRDATTSFDTIRRSSS